MRRAGTVIAAACALDALLGDPPGWPHPVRAMGAAIAAGERRLNAGGRGSAAAGAALASALIGVSALAGAAARRWVAAEIVLAAAALAARNLLDEAAAVAALLERGSLSAARVRVARIVGRDTAALDASGVARAAIETLAESACDGIVAPLFWLAAGGLPAALGFKAASTLDSMIGHRDERLRRFGAFAARTDDALNVVPARLTGVLIALAGGAPRRAATVMLRDAGGHASPNAGWPEAAMAGALGIVLGGPNTYGGVVHDGARFNAGARAAAPADIRRALGIVARTALAAELAAIAVRA